MAQRGRQERYTEWVACQASFGYWCDRWAQVYDASSRCWRPFRLWPAQVAVADVLQRDRLVVMLKARQLGMSWLTVAFSLWLMLFRPAATALLFSKRDTEAVDLLSFRLRGIYGRLPPWMTAQAIVTDNAHEFRLSNGSAALAFPTTGGRSYTGTLAMVDEADYCDLDTLLDAVKPTIDAGGRLVLLSTVDKARPGSAFKRIYQAARARRAGEPGGNDYTPVFLPWSARPDRSEAWYEGVRRDILARTGHVDSLFAEYPASDVEALAGLSSDARFAAGWLSGADDTGCARLNAPPGGGVELVADGGGAPAMNGLTVWERPQAGRQYVIGADPAEGNPQSDESAACVLDAVTGDQVAVWAGRFEPATFAAGLQTIGEWYARAGAAGVGVLVERNNHGHAVLLALREGGSSYALRGLDGNAGWLTTARGKAICVDAGADLLRDGAAAGRSPKVRDRETLRQLLALSGSSLAAPPGDHDDRALAWCLAAAAARYCAGGTGESAMLPPRYVVSAEETKGW